MDTKKKLMKEYFARPEVKKKAAVRMAKRYETDQGQAAEHKKRRTPRSRYMRGMYGAKRRKKAFTVTFEEYQELISQPCAYCTSDIGDETGVGLDRVDNDHGYVMGNVVPCCSSCNRIRHKSMGSEEFKRQTELNGRKK